MASKDPAEPEGVPASTRLLPVPLSRTRTREKAALDDSCWTREIALQRACEICEDFY